MAATEDETVPYSKSSTATRFFLTGGWVCGRAAAHMKRKNNETNPMRIMRDILMLLFTGGIRGRYFRKTLAELKGGYKDFATAGCFFYRGGAEMRRGAQRKPKKHLPQISQINVFLGFFLSAFICENLR